MAIISQPGPTFQPNTTAKSAEVEAKFDAIYTEFNGNIDDGNIKANAQITQSKILNLLADLNVIRAERVKSVSTVTFGVSGTYVKPAYLVFARIIVIGAGGGGGGANSTASLTAAAGAGGGSGGYSESWILGSLIGATEVVTIGQGGAAGSGGSPPGGGGFGGASSFGSLVVAVGGLGGGAAADVLGQPGTAAVASIGQIAMGGVSGHSGFMTTQPISIALGGTGGAHSPYSIPGVSGPTDTQTNGVGGAYGGGGSGGACVGGSAAIGGAGGDGHIIIIEFKAL